LYKQEIIDRQNAELCKGVTEEEITQVVKELPSDKVPGPDGIPAEFYKNCWAIVKENLIEAVQHFFNTKRLPPQWKSTFISLIPKVKCPKTVKECRPTSLCNVSYKIVTNISVNRLKGVLLSLISQEQSAPL